jgi:cytochrome c553
VSAPFVRKVMYGAAALVAVVAVLAIGVVYGGSEWQQRRAWDAPLEPVRAPAAADPVAGEHMARVVGCWAGCHGMRGQGGVAEVPGIDRTTAPTLTAVLPAYRDADLVRLIRYGVKRDGRSAVGMSSHAFWPLGDQDLADIIAHLRRQPPSSPVPREHSLTLRGRLAMLTGEWGVSAARVG